MSTVWSRRRERWAAYKEAVKAAENDPIITAAEFEQARRDRFADRDATLQEVRS